MEWLLDDIDEAIMAGVAVEKLLKRRRHSTSQVSAGYPRAADFETLELRQLQYSDPDSSRPTGTIVIATERLTAQQRVQLYLDALHRVFVELPEIEEETLRALIPSRGEDRTFVGGIRFVADEDTRRRSDSETHLSRERVYPTRDRLIDLFDEARTEATL